MAVSTSGLLVLTTDGELAHRLMDKRSEVAQEYAVRLLGTPVLGTLEGLVVGPGNRGSFDTIVPAGGDGANTWLHVALHEPRHRDVRGSFEEAGLKVSRLIRVRYGPIELGKMRRGSYRKLDPTEATSLYAAAKSGTGARRRKD
jgi:23S rRNA pseudouridine2605 synthase